MHWMILPLRRYAEFSGRSTRREFWLFRLFYWGAIVIVALSGALIPSFRTALLTIAVLAYIIPSISTTGPATARSEQVGLVVLRQLHPIRGLDRLDRADVHAGKPGR